METTNVECLQLLLLLLQVASFFIVATLLFYSLINVLTVVSDPLQAPLSPPLLRSCGCCGWGRRETWQYWERQAGVRTKTDREDT